MDVGQAADADAAGGATAFALRVGDQAEVARRRLQGAPRPHQNHSLRRLFASHRRLRRSRRRRDQGARVGNRRQGEDGSGGIKEEKHVWGNFEEA